jgi:hypothetical protein
LDERIWKGTSKCKLFISHLETLLRSRLEIT